MGSAGGRVGVHLPPGENVCAFYKFIYVFSSTKPTGVPCLLSERSSTWFGRLACGANTRSKHVSLPRPLPTLQQLHTFSFLEPREEQRWALRSGLPVLSSAHSGLAAHAFDDPLQYLVLWRPGPDLCSFHGRAHPTRMQASDARPSNTNACTRCVNPSPLSTIVAQNVEQTLALCVNQRKTGKPCRFCRRRCLR